MGRISPRTRGNALRGNPGALSVALNQQANLA
jgi:hypothetical protein